MHIRIYRTPTIKCVFTGDDNCNSALSGSVIWLALCCQLKNLASQTNQIVSVYTVKEAEI